MRFTRLPRATFMAAALALCSSSVAGQETGGMKMAPAPLGVAMSRLASGTTWTPDAVTLPSRQKMYGDWELMAHGFVWGQYITQSGTRGNDQIGSLNWAMLMATRELFGGRFQARTMLSADPATISDGGYPLLLQSGEQYKGQPIRDRQHPHDAFMEVALMYEREVTSEIGLTAYVAPAGEPALGPVAFMHRPSAMDNPFAPIGHHWQDATHISFGVATVGLFGKRWKLEASAFNAREPDDQRWNIDLGNLTSASGRVTVNPNENWSFALGHGFLSGAEPSHPDGSTFRTTASILHGRKLGSAGQWSTALVWGSNLEDGHRSNAMLAESEAILDDRHTLLGRVEYAQKSGEDLGVGGAAGSEETFSAIALSFGYVREFAKWGGATFGLGGVGTVNLLPASIESEYGSRTPIGAAIFVRLRPSFSAGGAMGHMNHSGGANK
jgi:hypothetical protein